MKTPPHLFPTSTLACELRALLLLLAKVLSCLPRVVHDLMDFSDLLMEMVGNVVGVVGVSSRTECNGEGFAISRAQRPQIIPFSSAVTVEEWCRHPLDNPVSNSNQCIYF